MKKPNIVVVGSSNTDMVIKVEMIPRVGETVLGGEFLTTAGGKGANQAVAAARAGGPASLVARLGRDRLGDQAMAGFLEEGIDVEHVSRDRHVASGAALIFVSILTKRGELHCGGRPDVHFDFLHPWPGQLPPVDYCWVM